MIPIDRLDVLAEISAASEQYESDLAQGNVAGILDAFWHAPQALRIGDDEELFGFDAIEAFRREHGSSRVRRRVRQRVITSFGNDVAAVHLVTRYEQTERIGRQSQLWLRTDEGWRVAHAHVSWPLRSARSEAGRRTEEPGMR